MGRLDREQTDADTDNRAPRECFYELNVVQQPTAALAEFQNE